MSEVTCKYCNKCFMNKRGLSTHLRTARYCMDKRQGFTPEPKCCCDACGTTFTRKDNLARHYEICVAYQKLEQISELTEALEKEKNARVALTENITILKAELKKEKANNVRLTKHVSALECKLAGKTGYIKGLNDAKPQTVNNTKTTKTTKNINAITYSNQKVAALPITQINPFTLDYVRDNLHRYTMDDYTKKEQGLIDFISSLVVLPMQTGQIERSYVNTDPSRYAFHRLVEQETWERDSKGLFIKPVMYEIGNYARKFYDEIVDKYVNASDIFEKEVYDELVKKMKNFQYGLLGESVSENRAIFNAVKSGVGAVVTI